MNIQTELLDRQQTADLLGTSETSIWRMTSEGTLPGYRKLGSQARWSRSVLMGWINSGCPQDAEQFELDFQKFQFRTFQASSTEEQFHTTSEEQFIIRSALHQKGTTNERD